MADVIVKCSGCGADIIWRFTERGKRMPLDAATTTETGQGVYILAGATHIEPYRPMIHGDVPRHMNHWATCPDRDAFRRGKERRA